MSNSKAKEKSVIRNFPLKWHGGKSYLAKWIHSLAPPSVIEDPTNGYTHRNIGCGGGLGEFWNWQPIEGISEAVNDANGRLVNFYAVLADEFSRDHFISELALTPFSDHVWQEAKEQDKLVPCTPELDRSITEAKHFFIRYRQSRQGLGKDYATPTRRTRRGMNENVSAWLSAVEGLAQCSERLQSVENRNLDLIDFIDKYDHARALFYLDPPYLHSTRSTRGGEYELEMSEDYHRRLLQRLDDIDGKFMLSGYHSPMYDSYAAASHRWVCHEKEIDNKASSKKSKPKKTECVWCNY